MRSIAIVGLVLVLAGCSGDAHDTITAARGTGVVPSYGLLLDGVDDFAASNGQSAIYGGQQMTFEAWIRPDETDGRRGIAYHMNGNYNPPEGWLLFLRDGFVVLQVFQPEPFECASPAPLTPGSWYFLAATIDDRALGLYVDGNLVCSATSPSPKGLFGGHFILGWASFHLESPSDDGALAGVLDDVRVSNAVRFQAEGFERPTQALEADEITMGLWHLDQEDHATDASGHDDLHFDYADDLSGGQSPPVRVPIPDISER